MAVVQVIPSEALHRTPGTRRLKNVTHQHPFFQKSRREQRRFQATLVLVSLLFIGAIGAVSVFKAVYVDRRELKCACVGGGSNVPLGLISLTENLMMLAMGIWMPLKTFVL